MSVQVVNKNRAKNSDLSEIVLFSDEKFQIKNGKSIFSKAQIAYIEKILKNKKNINNKILLTILGRLYRVYMK